MHLILRQSRIEMRRWRDIAAGAKSVRFIYKVLSTNRIVTASFSERAQLLIKAGIMRAHTLRNGVCVDVASLGHFRAVHKRIESMI